jgi:tetratricopeptide (TPR) repeat protein
MVVRKTGLWVAASAIAALGALPPLQANSLSSPRPGPPAAPRSMIAAHSAPPGFVDEQQCAGCHVKQSAVWRQSHHALAMQATTSASVLGDFANRTFTGSGSSARFTRAQDNFIVSTEGRDGRTTDFPVKYVFGVAPLQQYLLELPGGKLQALSIAWDVRQRKWFHLYPHETITPTDPLHWTQPAQNWNFMCAECHSTDVKKNYDPGRDTYASTWFQINVGCQACHGPGSQHVQWATGTRQGHTVDVPNKGFAVDLGAADSTVQIEACARCHSRRSVISPHYEYGKRLLDSYRPVLLDETLYHADGQQQDEVYEYGSFLQSKMARKGLRCSDCHDPHSAKLHVAGNALCATCHNAQGAALRTGIDGSGLQRKNYDSEAHYFHTPGLPGSHCIECHAPAKNYMVIDARIDHSFRLPRPDLTLKIGAPNACNNCHTNKSPQWALAEIQQHYPEFSTELHYGEVLAAGRNANAGAVKQLRDVARSDRYAAIVRASALRLLQRYPGAFSNDVATASLQDRDPLVRVEAVTGFSTLPIEQRQHWLPPLLQDSVRAVRIEAARLLAPLPMQSIPGLGAAIAELEASYTVNFDRPEARVGLADLRIAQERYEQAAVIYREALRIWPESLEAAVNLAELYRTEGRETEAETLLRRTLQKHPDNPIALQALAFSLIRQHRKDEALVLLEHGARDGRSAELSYLFGLALIDAGQRERGVQVLEKALARAPGDRDLLLALASQAQASGAQTQAEGYLRRLAAINPDDPALPGTR